VNGAPVFVRERTYAPGLPAADRLWIPAGKQPEIAVSAGDEIRLRTRLVAYDGPAPAPPLLAGFARLRVDRLVRVEREPAGREHHNVALVVLDTQRRDRLSSYGYERPTTPTRIDVVVSDEPRGVSPARRTRPPLGSRGAAPRRTSRPAVPTPPDPRSPVLRPRSCTRSSARWTKS